MGISVLVALDGSALAERALQTSGRMARATRGRLILMQAVDADHAASEARSYLDTLAGRLAEGGIPTETCVYRTWYESVAEAIMTAADERGADLIALSTHGHGGLGRWLYGRAVDGVLRHSERPVFLISAVCDRSLACERPSRLLVPLDGSRLAEEALDIARWLADCLGADLLLMHAIPVASASTSACGCAHAGPDIPSELRATEHYLEEAAIPLRRPGRLVELHTGLGVPAAAIAAVADRACADALVMATHGGNSMVGQVLGDVATELLHRVPVPILFVRPRSLRQPLPEPEVPGGERASDDRALPTEPALWGSVASR